MRNLTKILVILLTMVLLPALSAVPVFADDVDIPTFSTMISIPKVTSITIGGATAVYQ